MSDNTSVPSSGATAQADTAPSTGMVFADFAGYLIPGVFLATTTILMGIYEFNIHIGHVVTFLVQPNNAIRTEFILGAVFAFLGISYLLGHLSAILSVALCERLFVRNMRGYPTEALLSPGRYIDWEVIHRRRYYRAIFILLTICLGSYILDEQYPRSKNGSIYLVFSGLAGFAMCTLAVSGWRRFYPAIFVFLVICLGFFVLFWRTPKSEDVSIYFTLKVLSAGVVGILLASSWLRWVIRLVRTHHATRHRWGNWWRARNRTTRRLILRIFLAIESLLRGACWWISAPYLGGVDRPILGRFLGLMEPLQQRSISLFAAKMASRLGDPSIYADGRVDHFRLQSAGTALFWIPYLETMRTNAPLMRFLERQNANGVLIRNLVPALFIGSIQLIPLAHDLSARVQTKTELHEMVAFSVTGLPFFMFLLGLVCIVRYYHIMYERFTKPLLRAFAHANP